uniref:TFIIS central domain-containing protein n=1 Tax=Ciona savignyi TaxID=51511 RepID=H2ZCM9_CIOSA
LHIQDERNHGLWRKVIIGDVTTSELVQMTTEQMASKKLAEWRQNELTQELDIIEKQEKERSFRPLTKITHKGEIAIQEDLSDLTENIHSNKNGSTAPTKLTSLSEDDIADPISPTLDTTSQHNEHLFDLNCKICTGGVLPSPPPLSDLAVHEDTERSSLPSSKVEDPRKLQKVPSTKVEKAEEKPQQTDKKSESTKKESSKSSNALWSGYISMLELSTFKANVYPVGGICDNLENDLPIRLVLGGRIHPKVVWEYLRKVRTLHSKQLSIIRFHAATDDDRIGYVAMLSYFGSRKRFGVVSNQNRSLVKDMYLVPLLESQPIPEELVQTGSDLSFPPNRPSMLLGIVVRHVS